MVMVMKIIERNDNKMRSLKRIIILGLCICFAVLLTSCRQKADEDKQEKTVYEFGGDKVSYGEFYIYAKTIAEDYQKTYGNGVWGLEITTDDGSDTVKDITIKDIISDINRVKVMSSHAKDYDIALSDDELSEIEGKADDFFKGLTEKDIEDTGITKEVTALVMTENMLAKKVYDKVLSDYDFEISDEEARMTTFYDMVFECYEMKKDGSVEEYTPEKKAVQLEKANEALSALATEEDVTYENIVDKYNLQYSAAYTMSKTQMIEEYGKAVADKILELSDGEVSVVIETPYGYHIFKMLQLNDDELTKKNKAQIVNAMQKEYFSGVYEEWLEKYDSHFNIKQALGSPLISNFPFADNSETTSNETGDTDKESEEKKEEDNTEEDKAEEDKTEEDKTEEVKAEEDNTQ